MDLNQINPVLLLATLTQQIVEQEKELAEQKDSAEHSSVKSLSERESPEARQSVDADGRQGWCRKGHEALPGAEPRESRGADRRIQG